MDSTLQVDLGTTLSSTLDVANATILASTLEVQNATTLTSTLEVSQDASFNKNMYVEGTITLSGDLLPLHENVSNLGSAEKPFGSLFISNNTINFAGASAEDAGSLSFSQGGIEVQASGEEEVQQLLSVVDNKVAIGKASKNAITNLDLSGTMLVTGDVSMNTSLSVGGTTTLSSTLEVQRDASFNSNIYLSGNMGINTEPNANLVLNINSTNAIQLPKGTTNERPVDNSGDAGNATYKGIIRYNSEQDQFEGFGAGNAWGSLGGVKDVDQDTYITAETSANADNDQLQFYTAGSERMIIDESGDASFNHGVNVVGATTMESTLVIAGDTSMNNNLFVGGDLSLNGDLTIQGNLAVFQTKDTMTMNTTVNNYEVIITNDLSLNGDISTSGSATIDGTTTLSSTLTVNGPTTINANFSAFNITGTDLRMSYDVDSGHYLGKAHIGFTGMFDGAGFSHIDRRSITEYALLQNASGMTYLNSASGQSINFRISNDDKAQITSDGDAIFYNNVDVTKATTLSSTLDVALATTLSSTLDVTDATTLSSTLTVQNDASFNANIQLSGNMGINATPNSTIVFDISSNNAIRLPKGTIGERPVNNGGDASYKGLIRYNTDQDQFEGFGAGNTWGSLGGVKDVDGNTYISAETSAGADNNELQFFTDGNERMRIGAEGDVSFNHGVNIVGATNMDSTLVVGGDVSCNSNLSVQGTTVVYVINTTQTIQF